MRTLPAAAPDDLPAKLLDLMSDAVVALDASDRVRFVNRSATRLLGPRAVESLGQPVTSCLASGRRDALGPLLRGEVATISGLGLEGRQDQQLVVDVHAVSDEGGRVLVVRDRTEQIESQMVLLEVHKQQRELERLGQVGRWELDRALGELQLTEQVVELLRVDPLEMLGSLTELLALIRPDHRERFSVAVASARPGEELSEEVAVIRGDGSEAWLRVRGTVAPSRPTIVRGVIQDVTSLREALETARRTNENVVRFAGVVAHDLRSPVSTIAGMAELLQTAELSPDERAMLQDRILDNARTASEQIELVLEEALRTTSQLDPVPLDDVAAWVSKLVSAHLEHVGATLTWAPLPTVWGRVPLLRQCLLNLVSNAIKYGRDEGGRIEVSAVEGQAYWAVRVEDDGPGIPEQDRARVFEQGVRLDRDAGSVGSGIGLSAVRHVMARMGGTVHAESSTRLGGAALVLRLPKADRRHDPNV